METTLSLLAGLASAALVLGSPVAAQDPVSEPPPFGSATERRQRMAPRASKAAYTKKFDLSGLPRYVPERQVSGTLRIAGNNYIGDSPLAGWWTEGFKKQQPQVEVALSLPSATVAIPSLYLDLADIGMNHEPLFYDYLGHLRIKGYEPIGISALTGSFDVRGWQNTIVIAVNKANPLARITMKQLDGVFGSVREGGWQGSTWHPEYARPAEEDIRTWGQLGLTGEWAGKRINVYGYTLRYATALEFSNKVLRASDKWNGDLRAFANWRRPDGTVYGQAEQICDLLKKDPQGIAYVRYDSSFPSELRVLALAESEKGPYVEYTIENVQSRSYPLWGDQSFWVSVKPGTPMDPKIKEFLRYVLSQEGQEAVQRDGKYLPLTAEVVREELKKVK